MNFFVALLKLCTKLHIIKRWGSFTTYHMFSFISSSVKNNNPLSVRVSNLLNLCSILMILLIILFSGCVKPIPPEQTPIETVNLDSLQAIREARDRLTGLAFEIASESMQDSLQYSQKVDSLEDALTHYLNTTQNPTDELLLLSHNGSIILMPLNLIPSDSGVSQIVYADTAQTLHRQIGDNFKGEIVDLLSLRNDSGIYTYELAVLFPDSLMVFQNYLIDNNPAQIIRFDKDLFSPVKARSSNGILSNDFQSQEVDLSAVTSALDSSFMMQKSDNQFQRISMDIPFQTNFDSPQYWRPIHGQSIFQPIGQQIIPFRSFQNMHGSQYAAIIDESGFVHLLDKTTNSFSWNSSRPWGNKISYIGRDSLAVINHNQNSFVLFQRDSSILRPLGQSQEFPDKISAITPGSIGGSKGLLLALNNQSNIRTTSSRVLFIPWDFMQIDSLVKYPVPVFPNYDSTGDIVLRYLPNQADSSEFAIHHAIRPDIYETLFSFQNSQVIPLLAEIKSHNQSYTRWDFTINPDIFFSNGKYLNALDVKKAWLDHLQTCNKLNHQSQWIWDLIQGTQEFITGASADVSGILALDQRTLRVTLTKPAPRFFELLTHSCFAVHLPLENSHPLGTGPYQLTSADTANAYPTLNLRRNIYYHKGMPTFQNFQLRLQESIVPENMNTTSNLLVFTNKVSEVAYFRKLSAHQVRTFPVEQQYFLALNPAVNPLDNRELRQVIANAIDRDITASIISDVDAKPLEQFNNPTAITTETPENFGPQKFENPLKIEYQAGDLVSQHIAERLDARLTQLHIPHEPPGQLSTRDFLQKRISEADTTYHILIDSYIPSFQNGILNLADLLYRGYIVPEEYQQKLANSLQMIPSNYPVSLERDLVTNGYLVPIVSVSNFVAVPASMRNLSISGNSLINLSGAWIPR